MVQKMFSVTHRLALRPPECRPIWQAPSVRRWPVAPPLPLPEEGDHRLRRAEQQRGAPELELAHARQKLGQRQVIAGLGAEHPAKGDS